MNQEVLIGRGSFGQVFLLKTDNSSVVIKYIQCPSEHLRVLIERECGALERLNHPNIVSYIEHLVIIRDGQETYKMTMEYCERGTLRTVIFDPKVTYSIKTITDWAEQLFSALTYLWEKYKIVHRDVKPENIFATKDFTLKLGDFGCIKEGQGTVIRGTMVGTTRYMSPPQYTDYEENYTVTHRNDVYSMGLALWEVIERRLVLSEYGQLNFDHGRFVLDVFMKKIDRIEETNSISQLQEIVLKCTNFEYLLRPFGSTLLETIQLLNESDALINRFDVLPILDDGQKDLLRPLGFDGTTSRVRVHGEVSGDELSLSILSLDSSFVHVKTPNHSSRQETLKGIKLQDHYAHTIRKKITGRIVDKFNTLDETIQIGLLRRFHEIHVEKASATINYADSYQLWQRCEKLKDSEDIEELFESLLLFDFYFQANQLRGVFEGMHKHEMNKSPVFGDFLSMDRIVAPLLRLKANCYVRRFHFECYFSLSTKDEWLLVDANVFFFIKTDLSTTRKLKAQWSGAGDRTVLYVKDGDSEDNLEIVDELHYIGRQPVDLYMVIEAFNRKKRQIENGQRIEMSKHVRLETINSRKSNSSSKFGSELPVPGYIFQLRNPPRLPCVHEPKCEILRFPSQARSGPYGQYMGLPNDLELPFYSCSPRLSDIYLYLFVVLWDRLSQEFRHPNLGLELKRDNEHEMKKGHQIFFLSRCLVNDRYLILLDDPENYKDHERVICFEENDLHKVHQVQASQLRILLGKTERSYMKLDTNGYIYHLVDEDGKLLPSFSEDVNRKDK